MSKDTSFKFLSVEHKHKFSKREQEDLKTMDTLTTIIITWKDRYEPPTIVKLPMCMSDKRILEFMEKEYNSRISTMLGRDKMYSQEDIDKLRKESENK